MLRFVVLKQRFVRFNIQKHNTRRKLQSNTPVMSSLAALSSKTFHHLPLEEFTKKLDESDQAILIDLRQKIEFSNGAIEGALSMDILSEQFFIDIAKYPISTHLFIYCSNGKRSAIAGKHLCRMGYETTGLRGGYISLQQAQRINVKQRN